MSALDEKRFDALGQEWTVRFDFNAMCRIEEAFDKPFMEVIVSVLPQVGAADMEDRGKVVAAAMQMRMGDVRVLLREGLAGAHPDVTLDQAGSVIGAIGIQAALEVVAWGVSRALGTDDGETGGGDAPGGANPPRRKGKTG